MSIGRMLLMSISLFTAGTMPVRALDVPQELVALEQYQAQLRDAQAGIGAFHDLTAAMVRHQQINQQVFEALKGVEAASAALESECDADLTCSMYRRDSSAGQVLTRLLSTVPLNYHARRQELDQQLSLAREAYRVAMEQSVAGDQWFWENYAIRTYGQLEEAITRFKRDFENCAALQVTIEGYCAGAAVEDLRAKCRTMPDLAMNQSEEQKQFAVAVCDKVGVVNPGVLCRTDCPAP